MGANFKDGVIREGARVGSGTILGNIKNGIIRKGGTSSVDTGSVVANAKDGMVREGIVAATTF